MAGLYIHIPYCKTRCPYCDFFPQTRLTSRGRFEKTLIREMELRRSYLTGATVETVYFGGGTPSLFTPVQLGRILDSVHRLFPVSDNPEITLEANPDDVDRSFLKALLEAGINRLSLGTQSFTDEELKFLGRRHNARQNHQALKHAFAAGFTNISVDLIYGVPLSGNLPLSVEDIPDKEDACEHPLSDSGADDLLSDSVVVATDALVFNVKQIFSYPVTHLSAYHLTIEPGTPFGRMKEKGELRELDDQLSLRQFETLIRMTREKGMEQYELSNFSYPGYHSRHNSSYWQRKPYLGLGPSAHSYNTRQRHWSVAHLEKYMDAIGAGRLPLEEEHLSTRDHFNEHVITALRTAPGINLDEITQLYGQYYSNHLIQAGRAYLNNGQLVMENNHLKLSDRGKFISDAIMRDLMPG